MSWVGSAWQAGVSAEVRQEVHPPEQQVQAKKGFAVNYHAALAVPWWTGDPHTPAAAGRRRSWRRRQRWLTAGVVLPALSSSAVMRPPRTLRSNRLLMLAPPVRGTLRRESPQTLSSGAL